MDSDDETKQSLAARPAKVATAAPAAEFAPIIIDLGKKKKKSIKEFKRGEGTLILEVQQALADVVGSLGSEGNGKEYVPVVVFYRKKTKGRRRMFAL